MRGPPKLIAINLDDHHANHVGHMADGTQFFLTTPFIPPAEDDPGQEFNALFLFEKDGRFREARIDALGPRVTLDKVRSQAIYEQRIAELGKFTYGRIEVQPFQLERFGVVFGLIPRPPLDEEDVWWVELEPGNYMAFCEPWDSGEYDT
jgi:hypothetical protein